MYPTVGGIVGLRYIDVKFGQPANKFEPNNVTDSGIMIDDMEVRLNA